MALLMCGCAPEVSATNAAPAASPSPAVVETAAPSPSPAPTAKPVSADVKALLDENEEIWVENLNLTEALKNLNEREKEIVNLRYFIGKTQMEVSEEIGISQAQVSRLEKNAIDEMKRYFTV